MIAVTHRHQQMTKEHRHNENKDRNIAGYPEKGQ
jgi:hypothetical protein